MVWDMSYGMKTNPVVAKKKVSCNGQKNSILYWPKSYPVMAKKKYPVMAKMKYSVMAKTIYLYWPKSYLVMAKNKYPAMANKIVKYPAITKKSILY